MTTMIRRVCGVVFACALLSGPAFGAQVHLGTATGNTGTDTSSTKPFPSGLTATYAVGGTHLQIVANNAQMTALASPTPAMFTPAIPVSTTAVQLQVSASACSFANNAATSVACPNLSTLQVSFSRPVTNPVLHIVGVGSVRSVTGDTTTITASRVTHAIASSVPAGATMTVLPNAVNLQTLAGGSALDLVNTVYNGTNCSTITAPATQQGGCGSVRINGTVSSVTINVGLAGTRNVFNATIGNNLGDEAYLITTSVEEDFGDAPASYDASEAASHVVGGIRLGTAIDADNGAVLNGSTPVAPSPNAVAVGADNNGAAGDGVDEDGVATPLPTLHTGLIGQTYTLTPALSGSTAAGTVCGWIDFDRNGTFESAEGVCTAVASGATSAPLQWTVPVATAAGRTHVRLRATQGTQLSTATPTGRVDNGEVEDYMVEIKPAVRVIKSLSPTADTGRFDLSIGGTVFGANSGHNGSTGFRTLYHNSAAGAPDLTVAQNIATTAVTTTVSESPTAATTGIYTSTYSCVNGIGTTVATGNGTGVNITLPVSVTGAAANGRAQAVTCTFSNAVAALPTTTVLSINRASGNPNRNPTVSWTLLFAQPVGGLTAANLALVNGGIAGAPAITGVGPAGTSPDTQWNITASTGTTSGTLGLNLVNDTGLDRDVTNVPFTGQVFTIDRSPPTVTITVADTLLTAGETSPVTFVFNEVVDQLPGANITVDNGTLSAPTTVDSITWTATLTPTAGINDASNVITLNLAGIGDVAGNAGVGSTPSNNYAINNVVPVVCPANVPTQFSQNWSSAGLITANDDWSGVLGFTGYLGDIGSATNANPTTLTGAALGAVDVIANVTAVTNTSGGVAEMQIANPVVALQGSNTATTPSLVMTLDTTGSTDLTLAYTVRDIDSSADNAIQAFNAQYRIGSSGTWTNLPGTYIADATVGPSQVQATPVSVSLPAELNNLGVVQIRFMTNNVTGNDEWLGVDDITVTPLCTAPAGVTVLESGGGTSAIEGGTGDSYSLRLDAPPIGDVTVAINAGTQLATSPTSLTFTPANWATPQTVTVTAVDDRIVEGSPHAGSIAHAASGGGYDGISIASVNATVTDNDSLTYQFATASGSSSEGAGTANIAVTTTFTTPGTGPQRLEQAITVPFTVAGTATGSGVDYTVASSVIVPVNGSGANVVVTLVDDASFEPDETILLTLGNETTSPTLARQDAVVTPGAIVTHTHTIIDNDGAACPFTFPYTLAGADNATRAANLRAAIQCANANGPSADTILIGSGQTIAYDAAYATYDNAPTALPQITSPISITGGPAIIERSGGAPDFRLFNVASDGALSLTGLTLRNGHAGSGVNNHGGAVYTSGVFNALQSSFSDNAAYNGGAIYQAAGTLALTRSTVRNNLASNSGGGLHGEAVLLLDNSTVTGNVASQGGAIRSNAQLALVNTTITANTGAGATGAVTVSGTSAELYNTILADNTPVDCHRVAGTLAFSAGASNIIETNSATGACGTPANALSVDPQLGALTGLPAYFPLAATSPAINVGDNAIAGSVDQPGNARVQGGTVDLGSVESPFLPPQVVTLQFNAATSSAAEAAGFGNLLRVSTSNGNPTAAATTVTVNVTGGTATAADYVRTGTITIPAGTANNALVSIASGITVTNETLVEPNETLQLTLAAPAGATLGTQAGTTHTITNDDTATVTVGDVSQAEGNAGTSTMTFTVTVANPVQGGFALDYTTTALTASAGTDYVTAGGTLTFAGTAGESQTFAVTINGDTTVEPDETFRVSFPSALASVAPGSLIITDVAIGTITNDDGAALTMSDVSLVEGNTGTSAMTFTATLGNTVQGGFTVNYATANGTATTADADYVAASGTLTFAGTAGESETFTVAINGDTRVEANETFTVSLNTASNAGVNIADTATGTITNDDTASLAIADVTVTEGNAGTTGMVFTVGLDNAVQGGFTVNYATADGTATVSDNDYVAATGTLSFTGAAGQTRTFVVVINGDTKVEANEAFTVSLNTVSSPAVVITDTATGTINNNDTAAVTIANVSQPENGSFTFTATLSNATAAPFSVDWTFAAGTTNAADYVGGVLPTGGTLTFSGTTGETRTFTIPVQDDTVAEPTETFTIGMANFVTAGGFTVDIADTATGTITDNDSAGYAVDTSATAASIAEPSGSTTFAIRLTSQPAGTVLLDVGSIDLTECAVSPTNLTFNAGNWNAAQTITINAVDDVIVDGTQPCAATLARTGGTAAEYVSVPNPANVSLSVTDDDTAGITVNPTTIAVGEGGGTATFGIATTTPATGSVIVPILTNGQCEVDTGAGFSENEALTLPAGSTTPRIVTVRAVNDTVIEGAHTCAITTGNPTSSTDAFYDALGAGDVADVTANVTDNDVLHTVAAGPGGAEGSGVNPAYSFTITRSGATNVAGSVNYALGGTGSSGTDYVPLNPPADIAGAGITATATTIAFAANATTATVTVTVNADSIVEPDFTLALALTTPVADGGAGTGSLAGSPASLTVTDDDVAAYLIDTSGTAASIAEPSEATTFTVRLGSQPAGTVILDIGSTDLTECAVSPASFTFDAGNWNSAQPITIAAVDDALADGTQPCAATVTRSGGTAAEYAAVPNPANVNIDVTDDDVPGVSVTPTAVTATEGGADGSYVVVLDSQPSGNVTIAITGDTQVSTAPAALLFTAANWNIAQAVSVIAIDDAVAEGNHTGAITHLASGADYNGVAVAGVTVDIADNDAGDIIVTPTAALATTEAGGTATFTVVLASEPSGDVTIALSSSDTGEGSVAPATLLFDAATWDTVQTVTVTGVDDDVVDGDTAYTIVTAAAVSADPTYSGFDVADVAVTNLDDDALGVTIAPTTTTATEGGAGGSYTVVLDSEPTGNVSIAVATDAQVTATPVVLQFTAADWNIPQAVAVAAVDDAIAEGNHIGTVTHAATGADYAGIAIAGVTVDIVDNDNGGIVVTPASGLETTEAGGTATFTVVLASQPTDAVNLALSSSDTGEGTVAPTTLAFDGSNWNVAQTVNVNGIDDDVADGDVAYTIVTAAAVSADPIYNGVDAVDVAVTNRDDDSSGVTIAPTTLTATEGGAGSSYTVVLDSEPTGAVTIDIATDAQVTTTPTTLQFTAATWNVPQTVTVAAVDDAIAEGNHTGTITHAASGADYAGASVASVTVDITDNDSGGIVVTPTAGLETTEAGGTATFTVVLASEPTAAVTLALSSSDTSEGTVTPTTLAFDGSNWNVAHTVTVTGIDDDVLDGDVAYTILTAPAVSTDPSYSGVDADDVSATNADNDSASLRIDDVSLAEGNSGSTAFVFTVTLDGAIDGGVGVAYATADGSASAGTDYTATSGTLAFTGTDGETRTFTVPVGGDTLVEGDETFTVTLATPVPAAVTLSRAVATATVRNDDGAALLVADKRVTRIGTATAPVIYEIVLRNTGAGAQPDAAASDELIDVLPASLALRVATASAGTIGVDLPGNTVRWNGALAAGASVTVMIEADVVATVSGPISNRATARYDSDGDGENDAESASDNPDTVEVDDTVFQFVAGGVTPPVVAPQVIPTLDAWMLLWLSLGIGMFGLWNVRRQL